ncbi:LysM peptidoglycan-binding domain-containing protein [Actinospongicola halichondriae]|uniref:LysM peptidoglycan-binding domain-containing protein n=1 Tax=Actinospongicola halichondriae TaxID=3236844 RepID=UPI003D474576
MVAITTSSPVRHLAAAPARSLHAVPDRVAIGRRSWIGTAVLVAVLALAIGLLIASPAMSAGTAATLDPHVVVEGETMWSIAQDVAPAGEAATYVERLVEANGGASVAAGQVLTVPVP